MVLIDAKITQDVTLADGPTDKKCPRKGRGGTKTSPGVDVSYKPGTGPSVGVL
jgi:hypothetical protein